MLLRVAKQRRACLRCRGIFVWSSDCASVSVTFCEDRTDVTRVEQVPPLFTRSRGCGSQCNLKHPRGLLTQVCRKIGQAYENAVIAWLEFQRRWIAEKRYGLHASGIFQFKTCARPAWKNRVDVTFFRSEKCVDGGLACFRFQGQLRDVVGAVVLAVVICLRNFAGAPLPRGFPGPGSIDGLAVDAEPTADLPEAFFR